MRVSGGPDQEVRPSHTPDPELGVNRLERFEMKGAGSSRRRRTPNIGTTVASAASETTATGACQRPRIVTAHAISFTGRRIAPNGRFRRVSLTDERG